MGAYQIDSIEMSWPAGTGLGLTYQFFLVSRQPTVNTIYPGGGELSVPYVSPGLYAGDGMSKEYPLQYQIQPQATVLVMYVNNTTANAYNAGAVAIVSVND